MAAESDGIRFLRGLEPLERLLLVEIVGERGHLPQGGPHPGRRLERPGHERDLELRGRQLLDVALHLGPRAIHVEQRDGAGLVSLLGDPQAGPGHLDGPARGVDQRRVGDELVVRLRHQGLDPQVGGVRLRGGRPGGGAGSRDRGEARQIHQRDLQRGRAVDLIVRGDGDGRGRPSLGAGQLDRRLVLVACVRPLEHQARQRAAERSRRLRPGLPPERTGLGLVRAAAPRTTEELLQRLERARVRRGHHCTQCEQDPRRRHEPSSCPALVAGDGPRRRMVGDLAGAALRRSAGAAGACSSLRR